MPVQYRKLGNTDLTISRVVFGGIVTMDETQQDAGRYVAWAVERGVNYFDVAPSYGNAEQKLGEALRPYRSKVYLACKTTERSAEAAKKDLENSLRTLHTDYFDNYQFHSLTTQQDLDAIFAPGGAMETVQWAKERGYIRNIGFSAHDEEVALRALALFDFDTVLFPVNWALGLGKHMGPRICTQARKLGKGLLGMKTLAHRMWREGERGRFPKSWCKTVYDDERLALCALKYTLSQGADALVPPGNFEQFSFAADHIDECVQSPLNSEELAFLKEETEKICGEFIFPNPNI